MINNGKNINSNCIYFNQYSYRQRKRPILKKKSDEKLKSDSLSDNAMGDKHKKNIKPKKRKKGKVQ